MSKYELIKSLRQEIRKINRIIDQRIIMGMPYVSESRRHRFLVSQLNRIAPKRPTLFQKLFGLTGVSYL